MSEALHTEPGDGRRARSLRTRGEIADAMMDLIEGGNLQPTSEEVAARAGVGHRTVFRHFQDMDALYREIDARLKDRVFRTIVPVPSDGPLPARVKAVVSSRSRLYERIKMFRRATESRRWDSAFLQNTRRYYVKLLRERLLGSLPELVGQPESVQVAAELLLSFESWEQLRNDRCLSVAAAREVLVAGLLDLLG
jgi:AcrR family transcriptional regulator